MRPLRERTEKEKPPGCLNSQGGFVGASPALLGERAKPTTNPPDRQDRKGGGHMAYGNENARAPNERLLRIKEIIGPGGLIPVSKSTFWAGVKTGKFPKPVKVTPGVTAWRQSDLDAFIAGLGAADRSERPSSVRERPRTR